MRSVRDVLATFPDKTTVTAAGSHDTSLIFSTAKANRSLARTVVDHHIDVPDI